MGVTGKKKEMLFILGQFFKETGKRFSESPLTVSVSKAEFIDIIMSLQAVATKERAIYRNIEELQKEKYVIYDEKDWKNLKLSKKGYSEYKRILKELETLNKAVANIEAGRIKFRRKTQTKLK